MTTLTPAASTSRPKGGAHRGKSSVKSPHGLFASGTPPTFVRLALLELHPHPDAPAARVIENVGEEGGVWVPLIVKKRAAGGYTVLDGHARLHSARTFGLLEVPVLVADEHGSLPPEALTLMANVQRRANPIAEARGAQRLVQKGWTPADIRRFTGLDKAGLKRRLALLELDEDLLTKVGSQLSLGVLEAVARMTPQYREGVEAAILLKTADPEAHFTHDDLKALSVVRKDDLRAVVSGLSALTTPISEDSSPRSNWGSKLESAPGPVPPTMLFPERLELSGLVRAFVAELERGGHSLSAALELLEPERTEPRVRALPPTALPAVPVSTQLVPAQPVPTQPVPTQKATPDTAKTLFPTRASLGRRAGLEAR